MHGINKTCGSMLSLARSQGARRKFCPNQLILQAKDLFWFTVQITQFQKSLITGFLMIEMDSQTHCEYTECIFGMKMLFMVGGWAFSRLGG